MFEEREAVTWRHTAWIAAAALSAMRKRPVKPTQVNPWEQRKRRQATGTRNLRTIGMALFGIDIDRVKREKGLIP